MATNITATTVGSNAVGTTQIIDSTVALVDLNTTDVDTRYLTTRTDKTITGIKTISSDWVNTTNPWADNEVSDTLTLVDGSTVSATALRSGTVPNARLDSSSVTLQGNTFNGANQLVQLDGSGALPIVSGANLTNVTATNVGANSVGTTQIIDSPVALVDLNTTDVDTRYLTTGTDQTSRGLRRSAPTG